MPPSILGETPAYHPRRRDEHSPRAFVRPVQEVGVVHGVAVPAAPVAAIFVRPPDHLTLMFRRTGFTADNLLWETTGFYFPVGDCVEADLSSTANMKREKSTVYFTWP